MLSFLLDKVDGEIARYQKRITVKGLYLDEVYHLFVQNGLILAIGVNRFLVNGDNAFLCFGVVGYILFFLIRYIRKIRYIIYAHEYKSQKSIFLMEKNLRKFKKIVCTFLNSLPFRLCAIVSRHDIFLFLVIIFSVFYFSSVKIWFWLLFVWVVLSVMYFLRFLFLNYIFIDRDMDLIEKNKI